MFCAAMYQYEHVFSCHPQKEAYDLYQDAGGVKDVPLSPPLGGADTATSDSGWSFRGQGFINNLTTNVGKLGMSSMDGHDEHEGLVAPMHTACSSAR